MERVVGERRRVRVVAASVAVLVLGAAAVTATGGVGNRAGAAPNPVGRGDHTATITLAAADGSYQVRNTQSAELLDDEYELDFELAMHDGFRAPDDDEPGPPPYLRPEYVLDEATFDGEPGPEDFTREGHLLSAEVGGDVAEGDHEGQFVYTVNGAALPTDDGYAVYVRAADFPSSGITIDGSALTGEITGLRCQFDPILSTCGEQVGDDWELDGAGEMIIIEVTGDSDRLAEAVIDRE